MSASVCLLYVTTSSAEESQKIATALVREKLVACANIFPQIQSVFFWEEKVQSEEESVLVFKTTTSHSPKAIERIKELHSYDCPCVARLPIDGGSSDFLEWIAKTSAPTNN